MELYCDGVLVEDLACEFLRKVWVYASNDAEELVSYD